MTMYTATGTKAIDKEQFIVEFTPLVKRIAYHMMTRLPASVQSRSDQADDWPLDATNRYEVLTRQFESYANNVSGDPFDELREVIGCLVSGKCEESSGC